MTDHQSPVAVIPEIPISDMTPLERLLLGTIFNAEIKENKRSISFANPLGARKMIAIEREQLHSALRESQPFAGSTANDVVAALLDGEKQQAGADDRHVVIDMTERPWATFLQDIVRRSGTIDEIVVIASFTSARNDSDSVGGGVILITADAIIAKSTSHILDDIREKARPTSPTPAGPATRNVDTSLDARTLVVMSTGHVSIETGTMLDDTACAEWPCIGGGYSTYGWFVYAHEENLGLGDDRIPDDLFAVMTWARRHGFAHVLFDCDADRVDELEWFED